MALSALAKFFSLQPSRPAGIAALAELNRRITQNEVRIADLTRKVESLSDTIRQGEKRERERRRKRVPSKRK
jgi:hypothetical protein